MGRAMSEAYWRDGKPTDRAIHVFTMGDCWILAYELHRRTGWPICLVDWGKHYVVKAPGDRYLDITGVQTRGSLLRAWCGSSLKSATDDVYEECGRERGNYSEFVGSWRRAPVMARRLLDRYGVPA